jgi:serine O-acetyltransferase
MPSVWVILPASSGFETIRKNGLDMTTGDNFWITVSAKKPGDTNIGDNSIIGANTVVFKDVLPNCTVVGVPAYIVRCDGKKVRKPL